VVEGDAGDSDDASIKGIKQLCVSLMLDVFLKKDSLAQAGAPMQTLFGHPH